MFDTFQNWGKLFNIEFTIRVTKLSSMKFTNVFHFTADGNNSTYGDSIPAMWINNEGYFRISSAVNGYGDYQRDVKFTIGNDYKITIKQFIEDDAIGYPYYWYEIMVNGESDLKIKNTEPKNFTRVKLYTSDEWSQPFSYEYGDLTEFDYQGMHFAQTLMCNY